MAISGREINYSLRPAKNVERKMLCECFREVNNVYQLDKYRYIGFGSYYFSDFILFHKEFNIKKMISIERDVKHKDRYEFNKPFSCIDIVFGDSNIALNKDVIWDKSTKDIVWLDYDKALVQSYLLDLELCVNKAISGSIIAISFNSTLDDKNGGRLNNLMKNFDNKYIPATIKEKDLDPIVSYKVLHRIIQNAVDKAIIEKNSGYEEQCDKYSIRQIVFFKYRDGAPMLTLGYMIIKNSEMYKYEKCNFKKLDFYCTTNEPYRIDIPNFTPKELQTINELLPNKTTNTIVKKLKYMTKDDIEKYRRIYRYFPNFMEVF